MTPVIAWRGRARAVSRRHLDVLGPDGDVRARAGRESDPGRHLTSEDVPREGAVHLHGHALGAAGGRRGGHAPSEDHRLAEEVAHEGRRRPLVQVPRRPHLLDPPPVHHRDAVGEAERLDLVVGDEQHGDAEPPLEDLHLDAHLLAELGVEVAERLVEEQDVRLVDQRPAEREPLHLPAAQERGRPRLVPGEPDQVEHPGHLVLDDGALGPAQLERVRNVGEDRHVRPDRVGLKDHAEVALVGGDEESAGRRGDESAPEA